MKRHLCGLAALLSGLGLVAGGCLVAPDEIDERDGIAQESITFGELDGDDHPAVVLLLMDVDGEPMYRCSATVIAPTVVLTAGHCTSNYPDPPFTGMRIFTESDVENGDNSYPLAGNNSIEAVDWAAHPEYENAPFFFHDVGVVLLDEPVYLDEYPQLPSLNQFDRLKPRRSNYFTAVGYGLQRINPAQVVAERVRMRANPWLVQINVPGFTGDFSLLLSNNAATGGTCFGDSGGPNFFRDTNTIAGVTSFGLNGTCGGTGGVFRLDRADVLEFVTGFLE
ncbi:MAG: trypsin-like serine protease [Deltaproteobacteria bacterium]|nr:trypsin-like serine protease [Deltaproteobacteria bacterium]MBW2531622.1 trypsin-like serine protease [Deltaproteobacteria bacterium]